MKSPISRPSIATLDHTYRSAWDLELCRSCYAWLKTMRIFPPNCPIPQPETIRMPTFEEAYEQYRLRYERREPILVQNSEGKWKPHPTETHLVGGLAIVNHEELKVIFKENPSGDWNAITAAMHDWFPSGRRSIYRGTRG